MAKGARSYRSTRDKLATVTYKIEVMQRAVIKANERPAEQERLMDKLSDYIRQSQALLDTLSAMWHPDAAAAVLKALQQESRERAEQRCGPLWADPLNTVQS